MQTAPVTAHALQIDGSMVEGLFLRALQVSGPLADELRRIGIDLQHLAPHYPRAVFLAGLELAARLDYPSLAHPRALHELGRRTVEGFLSTLLGQVIGAAVVLGGADRVMAKLPRYARTGDASYDRIQVTKLGPGAWRADVNDPEALPDYFAGMTEAWLRRAHVTPTLHLEHRGLGQFSMLVSWAGDA